MKSLALIAALIAHAACLLGQNLSGAWTGFLDQTSEASKTPGYEAYYKNGLWEKGQVTHILNLSINDAGGKISGTYHIYTRTDESHYAKFSLDGTFAAKQLQYKTLKKTAEATKAGFGFCHNKGKLKYSVKDGYEYLEGPWDGWDDYGYKCASAWMVLRKKLETPVAAAKPKPEPVKPAPVAKPEPVVVAKPEPAKPSLPKVAEKRPTNIVGEAFVTQKPKVEIEIFDAEKEDGDIVSLSLNDFWILQDYEIRAYRRRMVLDLVKGDNFLVLYAKNLGEIPPNTATIVINDGTQVRRIVLNSDLSKSEGFKIVWK